MRVAGSTKFVQKAGASVRTAKLKIRWANPPCGFESHHLHHVEKALKMSESRKRDPSIGQGLFFFPRDPRRRVRAEAPVLKDVRQ